MDRISQCRDVMPIGVDIPPVPQEIIGSLDGPQRNKVEPEKLESVYWAVLAVPCHKLFPWVVSRKFEGYANIWKACDDT